MTWRKRPEHVMDKDIVEPSEWRINMNEFASEHNGFLDNDNIHEHNLGAEQVARDTFTKVLINQSFSQYGYLLSHEQSGWTNRADYLVVEDWETRWHGIRIHQWNIANASILTAGGSREDWTVWRTIEEETSSPILARSTKPSDVYSTDLPYHEFTTDTDALIIVDFHGTVSWQVNFGSLNSIDAFYEDWKHAETGGAADAESGKIKFTTSGGAYFRSPGYYYKYRAGYTLCSMWRIMVDGMIVAETGPLGSEYEHHPIYLCGAIPVSSGLHRVEVQAQLVWYSPGTDKTIQSTAGDYLYEYTDDDDVDVEIRLRHDCELRHPNLIAQIRSR
ncbi:hypothetical protein CMI37_23980 [Candidatus Pacearchaeota archaeon]|nr:hypothetical protein [Candidatus Pacearchaeota archaeon]